MGARASGPPAWWARPLRWGFGAMRKSADPCFPIALRHGIEEAEKGCGREARIFWGHEEALGDGF